MTGEPAEGEERRDVQETEDSGRLIEKRPRLREKKALLTLTITTSKSASHYCYPLLAVRPLIGWLAAVGAVSCSPRRTRASRGLPV